MYISENRQKNRKKSHKSSRRMPKTVRNIFPLQQKNILNIRDALQPNLLDQVEKNYKKIDPNKQQFCGITQQPYITKKYQQKNFQSKQKKYISKRAKEMQNTRRAPLNWILFKKKKKNNKLDILTWFSKKTKNKMWDTTWIRQTSYQTRCLARLRKKNE